MTTAFDAPLNEQLRDAMTALYLHEAVPNSKYLQDKGLVAQIKTANDLYEFWLLDVLVSQDVPTSPVACAIASLQQLVNGMMLNMEPGYSDSSFTPQQITTWQNGLNRYPIWAAMQQLHYFPDIYLDPTLRVTKTDSFRQFEADIYQADIQPEALQNAVMAHLARFEEVANVRTLNGYIDGADFANSTYYFIGKSPAENIYYWRSLDMRLRPEFVPPAAAGETPAKYDKPLPSAWSDWHKANVPISEKALEHTIRPCWFNNRLFVFWAELEVQDPAAMPEPPPGSKEESTGKVRPKFLLYGSYKKYDDTWSTPRLYVESYCSTTELIKKTPDVIASETQTIAVYDHSTSPESMKLMVYSGYIGTNDPEKDSYDFLRTLQVDKNFNRTPLYPQQGFVPASAKSPAHTHTLAESDQREHVLAIGNIFAQRAASKINRFQYWLPTISREFGTIKHATPHQGNNSWDVNAWQSRIKKSDENNLDLVYDRTNSNIELTVKLDKGFDPVNILTIYLYDRGHPEELRFVLSLAYNVSESQSKRKVKLLEGSCISVFGTNWLDNDNGLYTFNGLKDYIPGLISNVGDDRYFSVARTKAGESASLVGLDANSQKLKVLSENQNPIFTSAFIDRIWHKVDGVESELGLLYKPSENVVTRYNYSMWISHPWDVKSENYPENSNLSHMLGGTNQVSSLSKDSVLKYSFSINQLTHKPEGWSVEWPVAEADLKIPLIYGVLITAYIGESYSVMGAFKAVDIRWGAKSESTPQKAPGIGSENGLSPSMGNAQYIDFEGSSIELSDRRSTEDLPLPRPPIRLNTTFARHLIELGEAGMERLLGWETQHLKEPALTKDHASEPMDFSGAFWLYFVELFLYMPWLVAHRLNEEQQYEEAKRWLAYVFDPSRQSNAPGHPGYWQSVPVETAVWTGEAGPDQGVAFPDDPHQIAFSCPVHFQKALYRLYIDINRRAADQAYAELTPDGLAEAKLGYVRIMDLLGPRPDVRQADHWLPISLTALSTAKNLELRQFEQRLIADQQYLEQHPPLRIGTAPACAAAPVLCLRPYIVDPCLPGVDNRYLRRPFNPELIRQWDQTESRLYNLRHNRDIAGKALNLPLFAQPLDPRALLAAWGQGIAGTGLSRLLNPQIPHYRFNFMFALAQNAVDSLIQFGSTLLSLIERKEQAQYLELQQQQAWNLAKVTVDIQAQAVLTDAKNKEALLASRAVIAQRASYYEKLVNDGISPGEITTQTLLALSGWTQFMAAISQVAAETAKLGPNIFGLANGGVRYEGPMQAAVALNHATSIQFQNAARGTEYFEQIRRRNQEWTQARDQSNLELKQIDAQLAAFEEQHKGVQLQLRQAQTALSQARATHDFLLGSNRFSKSQTYDWLNSKFAGFYSTAFHTAQSLCQAAEACWQYEMANFSQTFIQPGAWNASYRGLGAGEELKTSLQQMHREYLQHNSRDLEIRKTVSLKGLSAKDPASEINKSWTYIENALLTTGTCQFELTQKMFEDDYLGQKHYLRRIKTISVTLPAIVGPYEDVCAVLTQTQSKVEMTSTGSQPPKENLRANQQIALSHGLDDNGQFQLNFQDERYLPFEYTGAISCWVLTFPNFAAQLPVLKSLTDIIVHVSYTARREGGSV